MMTTIMILAVVGGSIAQAIRVERQIAAEQ